MVEARVEDIADFGVFLEHPGGQVFVHLPEMSWVAPFRATKHLQRGQSLRVKIIREGKATRPALGSIRQAYPDENLYGRVQTGTVLRAMVLSVDDDCITVALPEHLVADFSRAAASFSVTTGSRVNVVVSAVEPLPLIVLSLSLLQTSEGNGQLGLD